MNDVKVQVFRGSQLLREWLYLDPLPEAFLDVELPDGRTRLFRAPVNLDETVMYGAGDCNVVISSTSTRRLFLVHIVDEQGKQLAKGDFRRLPEAEAWALRTLAEQRLFLPKETLHSEIIPLSEKEAEAFLSAEEEAADVPDEV